MIPQNIIDEILERTSLADIIGENAKLKKSGSRYVCCCPFHGEKTPSFFIYPDNHYYCFGCKEHGDAIDFIRKREGLDFVEAVKYLAERLGIEFTEKQVTEAQRAARMEKENLYACMETVYRDYCNEFQNSAKAQEYAYSRWGKEYCDEIGIGYAPGGKFIADKPYNKKTLNDLGLLNSNGMDFFYDRIVIPIRDRSHRVIGFTARRMDNEKKFKYINSKESKIFKKGSSLFGIDSATPNTGKDDVLYLVEGAPDKMRLDILGIKNSVSDLGTAWTDTQFAMIKRLTTNVCFIPDSDEPAKGKQFGPGTLAVMDAGLRAMQLGFNVYVKPIPNDTDEKQDPDSYFTSRELFDKTEEMDFIIWYAKEKFSHASTPVEKSAIVRQISEVLSSLEDKTQVSMYLDELKKFSPGKRVWQQAIEGERQRIEEEKLNAVKESVDEMEKQYGFHIEDNKYFSVTDKGSVYEWSNFILNPLFLILDDEAPQRLFEMINEHGQKIIISLDPSDLVSLAQFRVKVEQKGNFIWKATDKELIKLKSYLFTKTITARPIKQLGWQQEGFFAWGNGVSIKGEFIPTDDYGIVAVEGCGTFFIAANASFNRKNNKQFAFEHQFVYRAGSTVTLKELTKQYFKVYGKNAQVGVAFLLATLFKDIVVQKTRSFPLLDVFGPKGCGKSDFVHVLMSFFFNGHKAPSLKNSTMAALGSEIASVCNALIHLEEYKNDIGPQRIELLKGTWDLIGRTKMLMDKSGKKETSAVDCGIVTTGQEMPTQDIALFTRIIFLKYPKSEFTLEEKREHARLMDMVSNGFTHITMDILRHREFFEANYSEVYDDTFDTVSKMLENCNIEDRILKNWVAVLAAFRTLESQLDIATTYEELLNICIEGIKSQSKETKSNSELGSFFGMLEFLASDGDMIEECDYKIIYKTDFKGKDFHAEWKEPRPVLYLQKARVFVLYKMRMKSAGEDVIPEESLRYYLEQSRAFLGEKNMRYTVSVKGVPQVDPARSTSDKLCYQVTSQRSYCFDYLMLKKIYGISLGNLREAEADEE